MKARRHLAFISLLNLAQASSSSILFLMHCILNSRIAGSGGSLWRLSSLRFLSLQRRPPLLPLFQLFVFLSGLHSSAGILAVEVCKDSRGYDLPHRGRKKGPEAALSHKRMQKTVQMFPQSTSLNHCQVLSHTNVKNWLKELLKSGKHKIKGIGRLLGCTL